MIHLDIKPENYLLSLNPEPGNYLKLTDFDLTIPATTSYLDSVTSGSLMYLPLEHIRRKKVSKATDVYSFGVMAYNLYCYQTPFMKSVDEIADDYQIKFPSGFEERIPQEIRDFIEKCMHKFPEERFINVDSLLDSLLSIQRKLNKEKSTVHGQKEKGS